MSWFQQNAPPQQPMGSLGQLAGLGENMDQKYPLTPEQRAYGQQEQDWLKQNPNVGSVTPFAGPTQYYDKNTQQSVTPPWAQGGGQNGPQPVPGMPPQLWQGPDNAHGDQTFAGNRGSGQPINQPMNPNQGHVTPFAGPGWDYNYDPTTGRGTQTDASGKTTDYNYPASQLPQGSLQSLGGGWVPGQPDFMGGTPLTADNMQQQLQAARSIGQSGMVTLRGTDGTTKPVPAGDVAHWLSRGAVRV